MSMPLMTTIDPPRLAQWATGSKRSALEEMLPIISQPGIISFALGVPALELFPLEEYMQATNRVLATTRDRALQYQPPLQSLKKHVVRLMVERGVTCTEDQIFLTAGAQQGMCLLARLLLDHGGQVLLEERIYPGLQQIIEPYQPELLTVSTDPETGMRVEEVAAHLEDGARPAFIYTIPNGHNPCGVTLSRAKRTQLIDLARHYSIPIIEDDAYGFLQYDGEPQPPLLALDEQMVFYVGSFSKILAPALRVGWIVAPQFLMSRLSSIKEASDINTATFAQHTVAALLDMGLLEDHLKRLRHAYRERRETMLQMLKEHFSAETRWCTPPGGVFIWVRLPHRIDLEKVLRVAVRKEQVAFIPGFAFDVNQRREPAAIRLSFSSSPPEKIREGMQRLARVLRNVDNLRGDHDDDR